MLWFVLLLGVGTTVSDASEPAPFERQEITFIISGEHTAVVAALLAAVDARTPVTGIAALDSLAATYGLIGIYRKSRMSPFYGSQFRLTFPPGSDGAAIAGAYRNISSGRQRSKLAGRVAGKFCVGTLMGSAIVLAIRDADVAWVGYPVGVGLGTSLFDRHHYYRSLVLSIGGSLLGVGIGAALVHRYRVLDPIGAIGLVMIVQPITATLVSELFRKPPESGRFSVGLVPDARGNWSARATLRF